MPPSRSSTDSSFAGLIRSYLQKLTAWARLRAGRYGLAIGLLAIGVLLLAVALAVGTAAAFHFIELRYGIWTAYGVIGGGFAALAAVALIAGLIILKARPAAMPSPPSPARLVRHAVVPVAFRLASTAQRRPAVERTGLLAAGAAALLVVGWMVARQKISSSDR